MRFPSRPCYPTLMGLILLAALIVAPVPATREACPGHAPRVDRGEPDTFVDRYVAASLVDARCFGPVSRAPQHIFYLGARDGTLTVRSAGEDARGRAYLGVDVHRMRRGQALVYVSYFNSRLHGDFCRSVLPGIAGYDTNWIRRAAETCFREIIRTGWQD